MICKQFGITSHEGWQLGEQSVEAPILTKVGHNDCPHSGRR